MARGPIGLPIKAVRTLKKADLWTGLLAIDVDEAARTRVLTMETDFRSRIETFVASRPLANAKFSKFSTSPYVLLVHSAMNNYNRVSQIEHDIIPAKAFSSIETAAGKMIELVTFPVYGWQPVASTMTSSYSALDGRKISGDVLTVATLKSGPRCLNDEMAENFADTILLHAPTWAADANVEHVEFTYGVLYGTPMQSNKKDWHILRNLEDKLPAGAFSLVPSGSWSSTFVHKGISINAAIRIGTDWWTYLGGSSATYIEVWIALIRACVAIGPADPAGYPFVISDLEDIVSGVPAGFNVALLQGSQLQWLLFIARHFSDVLVP